MERKQFLKGLGLAGLGITLPFTKSIAKTGDAGETSGSCVLIPTETAGPFPLDLTTNTNFFRQDVRESKTGVQLNLKMKIVGVNNCQPMQNLRVNIWHCDKDGLYSGYSQSGNPGQAGLTYLRGYQITDANGEAEFITILPGWYNGRICHIHFQVYVSSSYAAISQLTFDPTTKNAIYTANSSLYTKGTDPTSLSSDNIFSDGYSYQMATLTPNANTGGYDSYLEVTIQGAGVLGVGNIEKETVKHMSLGQNYPNPFNGETVIPFSLKNTSHVTVHLWDISGKSIATILDTSFSAGEHSVHVNLEKLNLPSASYVYQIEVRNDYGLFNDYKMMTLVK